jgi:hypothetical protein
VRLPPGRYLVESALRQCRLDHAEGADGQQDFEAIRCVRRRRQSDLNFSFVVPMPMKRRSRAVSWTGLDGCLASCICCPGSQRQGRRDGPRFEKDEKSVVVVGVVNGQRPLRETNEFGLCPRRVPQTAFAKWIVRGSCDLAKDTFRRTEFVNLAQRFIVLGITK